MNYTQEQRQDFLKSINKKFRSEFSDVKEVTEGFVELENGTRGAIQTIYLRIEPEELSQLENKCKDLVGSLDIPEGATLYSRKEWELWTIEPSLTCPYTFNILSVPLKGYHIFQARFRVFKDGEFLSFKHLNKLTGSEHKYTEINKYGNWI